MNKFGTEHYVTLFDSLFLPQGLALHQSMLRHAGDFCLWIICMDNVTADFLQRLNLPNIRLINLSQLEDDSLKKLKAERSKGEYCWTLTPFAPRFVFETCASVKRVTYLDADTWFLKSPRPIFKELENAGKEVLITEHAYAYEYDQSEESGQYCVQFVTFTRDGGEIVRQWWEQQCREWCFNKVEPGRFGDQKYLEKWPILFEQQVHILSDKERVLGPWNITRFPRGNAVLYHFHGLRLISNNRIMVSKHYKIPIGVWLNIYKPYLLEIQRMTALMSRYGITLMPQSKDTRKIVRRMIEYILSLGKPPLSRVGRGEVVKLPKNIIP